MYIIVLVQSPAFVHLPWPFKDYDRLGVNNVIFQRLVFATGLVNAFFYK